MMVAECYAQLSPTYSRAQANYGDLRYITVNKLTQSPPREVTSGAVVVRLVFEIDETIFTKNRMYPTATIQVDEAVADMRPALFTAMSKAKF